MLHMRQRKQLSHDAAAQPERVGPKATPDIRQQVAGVWLWMCVVGGLSSVKLEQLCSLQY